MPDDQQSRAERRIERIRHHIKQARTTGAETAPGEIGAALRRNRITENDAAAYRAEYEAALKEWASAGARYQDYLKRRRYRKAKRQQLRAERAETVSADNSVFAVMERVEALLDVHDVRGAADALRSYFSSEEQAVGSVAAYRLLLMAERMLIASDAPAGLINALDDQEPGVGALKGRMAYRAANPPLERTDLIALGYNCLPWTLPNRWGMRPDEALFDLDCPFNQAVHDLGMTLRLIESDFEGYSDPREIKVVTTQAGHRIAFNPRYKANWNHEKNGFWLDNDCAVLRQTLDQRIENFRRSVRGPKKKAFLIRTRERNPETHREAVNKLADVLRSISAGDVLLVVSSSTSDSEIRVTEIGPNVVHHQWPRFPEGYIWHDEADFASPVGQQFESTYVSTLREILTSRGFV